MRIKYFFILAALLAPVASFGQGLSDALRLSGNELPTGMRNTGLDGALLGSINGYDALQWNPAALAPLDFGEFGISLYHREYNSTATFLQNTTTGSDGFTPFPSLGLAAAIPTRRGHLAWAISYDQVRDFTSAYAFSGMNPSSSFLNTRGFVDDPGFGKTSTGNQAYLDNYNLAWALHLTFDFPDSGAGKLTTPFQDSLQESGTVTQEGNMRALRIGAGIDIAEGISVGATLNVLFGDYTYRRVLNEVDVLGRFAGQADSLPPLGFLSAQIVDTRDQTQNGANLKLGLLAYRSEVVKFGLTIETPTIYVVSDHFHRSGTAHFSQYSFNSGDTPSVEPDIVNTYDIVTPLKAGVGASVTLAGLTVSGSGTFADMSELRFTNSDVDLSSLNDDARQNLRAVFAWQLGAEYLIAPIGLGLRAGYGIEPSAYKGDPSSYDQKTMSAGISLLLSKSVILEAAYRRTSFTTDHLLYDDFSVEGTSVHVGIPQDNVVSDAFSLGVGYRF